MPSADPPAGLTSEQVAQFQRDGYLIVPDALSPATVQTCLAETHKLLDEFDTKDHPMTQFKPGERDDHVGDRYFLESGDKVRFFFEEDAFTPSGTLSKPKERAINKIGHFLHGLSQPFHSISISTQNSAIARSLGFTAPRLLQSMVICKQPEIGGAVPPHQDSTFLYTDPPSAIGFWYALEDATTENGCLSFAKGSHKRAEIKRRFVRQGIGADGEWETGFVDVEGARFPRGLEREREAQNGGTVKGQPRSHAKLTGETQKEGGVEKEEEYTIGPVKAGTLVLIHGNVLHKSEKNLSGKSRFIYTFHVIEGDNEYDERNWLQPPEEGFSRL